MKTKTTLLFLIPLAFIVSSCSFSNYGNPMRDFLDSEIKNFEGITKDPENINRPAKTPEEPETKEPVTIEETESFPYKMELSGAELKTPLSFNLGIMANNLELKIDLDSPEDIILKIYSKDSHYEEVLNINVTGDFYVPSVVSINPVNVSEKSISIILSKAAILTCMNRDEYETPEPEDSLFSGDMEFK